MDIEQETEFITNHAQSSEHEILQANRCVQYFNHRLQNPWADLSTCRADFYRYFNQFDQRNGTNFRMTFPRLARFFDLCATSD